MHNARINATFDQLPAAHAQISATGSATTKKAAAGAALRNLLNHPNLKGKRYDRMTATIVFFDSSDIADTSDTEDNS